jgi:hypothetical protein
VLFRNSPLVGTGPTFGRQDHSPCHPTKHIDSKIVALDERISDGTKVPGARLDKRRPESSDSVLAGLPASLDFGVR